MTSDGVKRHCLDQGADPAIVLLPGWTQSVARFPERLMGVSADLSCQALDLRGQGESERPDHRHCVARPAWDCLDFLGRLGPEDLPRANRIVRLAPIVPESPQGTTGEKWR